MASQYIDLGSRSSEVWTPEELATAGTNRAASQNYFQNFNTAPTPISGGGGPGVLSTVGTFLASPAAGAVTGIVGLIGKGIGAWLKRKREKEAQERADAKYKEYMSFEREKWEQNVAFQQATLKLNRTQAVHKVRQDRQAQKNYTNERNNKRADTYYSKLMQQLNMPDAKSTLSQVYGRAA